MASLNKQLFDEAVSAARKYALRQREADLKRSYVKRYDSRGVHLFSYEVGRAQALIDADPELRGVVFDPVQVRAEAWDEAEEAWQRSRAVDLLVDAAADRHEKGGVW